VEALSNGKSWSITTALFPAISFMNMVKGQGAYSASFTPLPEKADKFNPKLKV
jgi:hypothetical protein